MNKKNLILKNKNILVTGADGFIGSHLVEKLVQIGCNVRAMAMYNSHNSWGWLDDIDSKTRCKIHVTSGDIRDYKYVRNSLDDIDIVFHLASLIAIPYSYHSPNSYVQTNVQGTLNILEASLNKKVEKIVHTSTSEVYGDTNKVPISEQTPIISKSPYSATKIAADQLAYSYFSTYGLPVSIIRPFNTYGPRQSNRAIIPTILTQILSNKNSINLGSIYPTRDFSYIDDTVEGFIKIAHHQSSIGQIINIGSGYEISIKDLVSLIEEITSTKIKIITDKNRVRPNTGEVIRLKADNRKAKKLIKWTPEYSGRRGLKKGLVKTMKWLEENIDKYKTNIYNL